jgi:uncharacterized protein YneF (UPF0154 family)
MRVLLIVGLILGVFFRFASCHGWATEIKESPSIAKKLIN